MPSGQLAAFLHVLFTHKFIDYDEGRVKVFERLELDTILSQAAKCSMCPITYRQNEGHAPHLACKMAQALIR